jgi:hypothetical protein
MDGATTNDTALITLRESSPRVALYLQKRIAQAFFKAVEAFNIPPERQNRRRLVRL